VSKKQAVVSLRTVAERVGLAVCSISAILNETPASEAIPQRTKDRVFRAAAELNYRPNLWARSLRTNRTRMVAAITSDIGLAPVGRVLAGVQSRLHRRDYLLTLRPWDCTSGWRGISVQLQQRGIEGIVAIGVNLPPELELPVASVDLSSIVEPLAEGKQTWLSEMGEAAAEEVIQQIEKRQNLKKPGRNSIKIVPKLPNAYFGLASRAAEISVSERV
jgi:DNA-binding LacI/PurR family transcriptional regulator